MTDDIEVARAIAARLARDYGSPAAWPDGPIYGPLAASFRLLVPSEPKPRTSTCYTTTSGVPVHVRPGCRC